MLSSPLMSELVRTLQSVSDPAGELATGIRGIRVAESDLRRALEDLAVASSRIERQICIARRDRAMQELIQSLQVVSGILQRQTE